MRRVMLYPVDTLITEPTREPLDLEEVKKLIQGAETSSGDDTLIDTWISAARQDFEEQTGRQIMTATREARLDGFPCGSIIEVPRPPLESVTSIKYIDTGGTEQTLDPTAYVVQPVIVGARCNRGTISLASGHYWPQTSCREPGAVRIRFVAGYGNTIGDVPELIRTFLSMRVKALHCAARCTPEAPGNTSEAPLGSDQMIRSFTSKAQHAMWHYPAFIAWPAYYGHGWSY